MRSAECGIDARTSIPHSEFRIPHRLGRRQHPKGEPDAPPSRQPAGDARRSHQPREGVHDAGRLRDRDGPESRAHHRGHAAALRQERTGRLEPATVAHARRTDWLASPAAQTAVEVQGDARIAGSELARLERAHQLDAAAGAVGFVTGSEEGGARLETEAAMNTGIQPFEAAPIRHSVPSTATTKASPGSNVRRTPATSGPTPSR